MQCHILRRIECELQSHVVQRLGDNHAAFEVHAAPHSIGIRHSGLGLLRGRDVQRRIHRVARKLNIASILNGEGLQRDDGERVFHLTVIQRITPRQSEVICRIILHAQVSATHQVDIVRMVGIQVSHDMSTLGHGHGKIHAESVQWRTVHDGLCGIGKVGELH